MWWVLALGVLLLAGRSHGDEVVELAPLEVAAWHFDGLAMGVPGGVGRLERGEIELSGSGDVPSLLAGLAGVRFRGFTGGNGEGSLAMRGFGDNSGLRVLVLVDGQVYNAPDMGGINWLGLDIGELETVEVLRGGQTVLYGNHAVSGVVKLRTRDPGEGLAGRLRVEIGSDGLRRLAAGAEQGFGEWGLRLGGHWMESDGPREHSRSEAEGVFGAWNWGSGNNAKWAGRVNFDRSTLTFPGPLSYEQMQADPRQSTSDGEDISESEVVQGTVRGEGEASWGKWQALGGFLERDNGWILGGSKADNRLLRANLAPRIRWGGEGGFVQAGLDLLWDQVDYTEYHDEDRDLTRAWADLERLTGGAYLFGEKQIATGLSLSGGIRAENARTDNLHIRYKENQLLPVIKTNRGEFPNPDYRDPAEADPDYSFDGVVEKSGWAAEVSLLQVIREGLTLWAGWDRVYRYPALDEAAAYQGYPLSEPLNSGLDPETGNNFEAGIKGHGANWHAGVTVFLMHLDDEISFVEERGPNGELIRLNKNIGDTRRLGLEMEFSYQRKHYGVSANASLTEARFRGGEEAAQLPLVPKFEGGLTGWVRPFPPVRLQMQVRYLGEQVQGNDFASEFRTIDGYGLVDLSLRWDLPASMTIEAGINNLLDTTHAVTAYSGGFYPGAGRRLSLRATRTF